MAFTHFLTSAYPLPKNDKKKSAASFWQFSVEYRLHKKKNNNQKESRAVNSTKIASKANTLDASTTNTPMLPGFAEFFEVDYG